mgnify:CR=1 FL=1
MAKRHYIPVTADVPGAASEGNCALIRKVIRTALAAEGVDVPCEVDVLLTGDAGIASYYNFITLYSCCFTYQRCIS